VNGSDTVRRALRERVARKVAGSGISPRAIERAVDAVVDALPRETAGASRSELIAALSARSVPDLGSRVRAALQKEGVGSIEVAVASAGQHNVVTLRFPSTARDAVTRIAGQLNASLTILDGESAQVSR
jgi:hypothetical protein